jgi:hypothetical protein
LAEEKDPPLLLKGNELYALPMEPSIDKVIRDYLPDVEKEWKVKLSTADIFRARQMLVNEYRETVVGLGGREPWIWSPYFVFIEIPMFRTVLRLPNGQEIEDVQIDEINGQTQSQNLIIIHCLELIAREKQLDNYIGELLGEIGYHEDETGRKLLPIEEIMKHEYPEIFISGEEYEKFMEKFEKQKELAKKVAKTAKFKIGDVLSKIGLDIDFMTARGPYEFALQNRITKQYQTVTGPELLRVVSFLKSKFEVPGFSEGVPW